MKKKRVVLQAVLLAAMTAFLSSSVITYAEEAVLTAAEEPAPAPEPEPAPAPEPEPAPAPEPAPEPTPEPAPTPETAAPTPETAAPAASSEIVSDPNPSSDSKNTSTSIPKNPKEKKQNIKVVDAGETDNEVSVSINGGAAAGIKKDAVFREVIAAIMGGNGGYQVDYVIPGIKLREKLDVDSKDSLARIFAKAKALPDASMDIVLYGGNTVWLTLNVSGEFNQKNTAISFSSANDVKTCTITYDANGGTGTDGVKTIRRKGECYSRFDVVPSREGMSFCGWYDGKGKDANRVFPTDKVKKDITLYARWRKYGTETVVFDFGYVPTGESGNLIQHLIYPKKKNGKYNIANYPIPRREGYAFDGWVSEDGSPARLKGLTGGVKLVASWKKK